jgi:hypothetical protein
VVEEIHDAVPHIVIATAIVGVELMLAKLKPRTVKVMPPEIGELSAEPLDAGESYVKPSALVPTTVETKTTAASTPYPAGDLHVSEVADCQEDVLHINDEPTYTETVVSSFPKFMPSSVREAPPAAAKLDSGMFVMTGASNVKPLTRVPITADTVTAEFCLRPAL